MLEYNGKDHLCDVEGLVQSLLSQIKELEERKNDQNYETAKEQRVKERYK